MTGINLHAVAGELRSRRPNLPHGIKITVDKKTRNLLVANDDLGFAITNKAISQGLHLAQFDPCVDHLIRLLDEGAHLHNPEMFTLEKIGNK